MSCLVDTHFHLELFRDHQAQARAIEQAKIYTIAVSNAPSFYRHFRTMLEEQRFVRHALGLHPELVSSHGGEMPLFRELLPTTRYVGEVGLDFSEQHRPHRNKQIKVLGEIADAIRVGGKKVVSLHSRRAEREVVELFGPGFPAALILHWYSGSIKNLEKALEYGFYFSVNPAMCRSEKGRSIIASLPRERVLTETDGPFVLVSKKPATPQHVSEVVRALQSIWGCDSKTAMMTVFDNFRRVLNTLETSEVTAHKGS